MKILRGIIVALALYSKLPVPNLEWCEEDMKYTIAFLPIVGMIISALEIIAIKFAYDYDFSMLARVCIFMIIPIAITGGFHIDGFMDVSDALKSYKPQADKLAILKDPHVGAFAIISLVFYGLAYVLGLSFILIDEPKMDSIYGLAICFYVVRTMTSLISITFRHAKRDGMLHEETKSAGKTSLIIIAVELIVGGTLLAFINPTILLLEFVVLMMYTMLFKRKMYKEFGGISGDMAGYYLLVAELVYIIVLALVNLLR